MKSLADNLPPEFAAFVHPDWRKNEADYWAVREQLLEQYRDQWIGFANGAVIASGKTPVMVVHQAEKLAEHPFCTCVGREDEPERIRRVAFPYDTAYVGEPLPLFTIEFRAQSGGPGVVLDRVFLTSAPTPARCHGPTASDFRSTFPRVDQEELAVSVD